MEEGNGFEKVTYRRTSSGKKLVNQYEMIRDVGKGQWGRVVCVRDVTSNKKFALKIFAKSVLSARRQPIFTKDGILMTNGLDRVCDEVLMQLDLDHPFIVKAVGILDDDQHDNLYLGMEYLRGGPVMNFDEKLQRYSASVKKGKNLEVNGASRPMELGSREASAELGCREGREEGEGAARREGNGGGRGGRGEIFLLTETAAFFFVAQIAKGLLYLHDRKIIHKDVKPENVLLTEKIPMDPLWVRLQSVPLHSSPSPSESFWQRGEQARRERERERGERRRQREDEDEGGETDKGAAASSSPFSADVTMAAQEEEEEEHEGAPEEKGTGGGDRKERAGGERDVGDGDAKSVSSASFPDEPFFGLDDKGGQFVESRGGCGRGGAEVLFLGDGEDEMGEEDEVEGGEGVGGSRLIEDGFGFSSSCPSASCAEKRKYRDREEEGVPSLCGGSSPSRWSDEEGSEVGDVGGKRQRRRERSDSDPLRDFMWFSAPTVTREELKNIFPQHRPEEKKGQLVNGRGGEGNACNGKIGVVGGGLEGEDKAEKEQESTSLSMPCVKLGDFTISTRCETRALEIYDAEGTQLFTPPECFKPPEEDDENEDTDPFGQAGGEKEGEGEGEGEGEDNEMGAAANGGVGGEGHQGRRRKLKAIGGTRRVLKGGPRDVWSLGCLLFVMLFGKCPFWGESPLQLQMSVLYDPLKIPEDEREISAETRQLLEGLLAKDPEARLTLEGLLSHPLVRRCADGSALSLQVSSSASASASPSHAVRGWNSNSTSATAEKETEPKTAVPSVHD
uniref:Protein kinase domain-containing protein n=1 Tax=Chromera velia CCMP2878 TaxID=1169474 RepID=A0A0G4G2J7_9ALVE|eukprot:Cvel_4109.t1-p1 / transcript=Cvel_4109.t1 / gene=Cvel_4109 / organism=Chromera_velia_CCMP2878 / gene_product=Serine/threonine-protein kinase GRIK2, putative / transcript_product=Serine/threonine-protein kinase GRIK2, putative / location=Cvel_scaffold175:50413-56484(-) / protein_length=789 / sequence_SO=supercontig / SO=protein_coding / is_pseudo=false